MGIILTLTPNELQSFQESGLFSGLSMKKENDGPKIRVTIGHDPATAEGTLRELKRRLTKTVRGYFYDTDDRPGNGTPELLLTAKQQRDVIGIFRRDGEPAKVTEEVRKYLGGDFEAFKNLLAGWNITAERMPDHGQRYSKVIGNLRGGLSVFDKDGNLSTSNDSLWIPSDAVRNLTGWIDRALLEIKKPPAPVAAAAPAGADPAAAGGGDAELEARLGAAGGEGAALPADQAAGALTAEPGSTAVTVGGSPVPATRTALSVLSADGPVKSVTLPGPLAAVQASGLLKDLDVETKEVEGQVEVKFKNPLDSFKFSVRVKEAKRGYLVDPDKDPKNGNEVWQVDPPDRKLNPNVTMVFGWGGDPAKPNDRPSYVLNLADFLKLVGLLPLPIEPVAYKGLEKVQPDALAKPDNYIFFPLLFNTATNEVERYMVLPAQNTPAGINNMIMGEQGIAADKVPLNKITHLKSFPPGYRLPTFEEVNRYIMDNLGVFAITSDMGGMEERYRYEKDYLRLHQVSGLDVPVLVIPKAEEECSPVKHMEKSPTIISNYVTLKFPVPHDVAPQLFELLGASPEKDDMCAKGMGYGWDIADRIEHFIDPIVPDWINEPDLEEPKPGTHFFTVRVNKGALIQARAAVDRAAKLVTDGKEPPSPKDRLLGDEELMTYRAWLVVSELDSSGIALLQDALGRLQDSIDHLEKQGQRVEWGTPWFKLALALAAATGLGAALTKTGREAFMMTLEKVKKLAGFVPDYLEDWHKQAASSPPYDSSVANREKIIREIMARLGSAETGVSRSVMMIGESSQGKTAMMKEIARRISVWQRYEATGELPPDLRDVKDAKELQERCYLHEGLKESVFFAVKFDDIGKDISLLGQWEKRVSSFKRWLKIHPEAILYGDEFQKAIGVGEASGPGKQEGKRDLYQHLKEEIADGKQSWVVSTTLAEYHLYVIPYDPSHAFIRRFELITLESYSPEQVKHVMRQIANKLMPKDGIIVVDEAGTDALVEKLMEAGTPEFLLLNEAKNLVIDAANDLRRKILEGDPTVSASIDSEVRDVLINREKTALRIRNLRNRVARTSFFHPVKLGRAKSALKALELEYDRLQAQLTELAGNPSKRITITAEMLFAAQKLKEEISGREAGKALETETRRLKGEILQIQRELKRYKVELPITKDVDAERYPGEEPFLIVRRLRRLHEAAKKLLGMYEVKREAAGPFGLGGGSGPESSMADIQKQLIEVRRLAETNGYDPRLDDIVTDDPQKTELAVTRQQIRDALESMIKESMRSAAELGVDDRDVVNRALEQRTDEPNADYKLRLERVKKALEGHRQTLNNPADDDGTKKAREAAAKEIGKIFGVYQGDTTHPMPAGADAQTRKIVRTMISLREDVEKLRADHGVELVIPDSIDQPRKADGKPDEKPSAIARRLARVHAAIAELLRMHEGGAPRGGMGGMGFPGMGEMEMPPREASETQKARQKEKVEKLLASGGYDPELDEVKPAEPEETEEQRIERLLDERQAAEVEALMAEIDETLWRGPKRMVERLVHKSVLSLGEALSAYFCHHEFVQPGLKDILTHLETLPTEAEVESYLRELAKQLLEGNETVLDARLARVPNNDTPAKRSVSYLLIILDPKSELVQQQVERRSHLVEVLARPAGSSSIEGLKATIPLRYGFLLSHPQIAGTVVNLYPLGSAGTRDSKQFGPWIQSMFNTISLAGDGDDKAVVQILKRHAAQRTGTAVAKMEHDLREETGDLTLAEEAAIYLEVIQLGKLPTGVDLKNLTDKTAVEMAVIGRLAGMYPLEETVPALPADQAAANVVPFEKASPLQRLRAVAAAKIAIQTGDKGECREIEDLFKKIVGGDQTAATDEDKNRLYQAIVDGTPLPADWKKVVEHYVTKVLRERSPINLNERARLARVIGNLLGLLGRGTPPPDGRGPGGPGGDGAPRGEDDKAGRADPAAAPESAPAAPDSPAGPADSSSASARQGAQVVDLGARRTQAAGRRHSAGNEGGGTRAMAAPQLDGVSNEGVASGVLRGDDGRWYQVPYEVVTPNFCSDAPAPIVILRDVAENRLYARELSSQGTVVVLYKAGRELTGFEIARLETVVRGRVASVLNVPDSDVSFARETEGRGSLVASKPLPKTLKALFEEVGLREDERARALREGTFIEHLRIHLALAVQKDPARYEDLAFQLRVLDEFIKARGHQFPNRAEMCLRFVEGYLGIQDSTGAGLPASLYVELVVQRRFEEQRLRDEMKEAVRGIERREVERTRDERKRRERERVK